MRKDPTYLFWDDIITYTTVLKASTVTEEKEKYGLEDIMNTIPNISYFICFRLYEKIITIMIGLVREVWTTLGS